MEPDKKLKAYTVGEHTVIVKSKLVKIGQLKQEFYYHISDPEKFLNLAKKASVRMDLFTFLEPFPQSQARGGYHTEWENFAVIPVHGWEAWHKELPKSSRRGIRKAKEAGIEVRWIELEDEVLDGITTIFNESEYRQGKVFWHYGKDRDAVRAELSLDGERSRFMGAYIGAELIGFIKFIFGDNYARTTLILSKIAQRPNYPNNALISKAVEMCAEKKIPYLVYGHFDYGKVGNKSLSEFKENMGFKRFDIPRYYAPLTLFGKLALRIGLQHGILAVLPQGFVQRVLNIRRRWYARRQKAQVESAQAEPLPVAEASATEGRA